MHIGTRTDSNYTLVTFIKRVQIVRIELLKMCRIELLNVSHRAVNMCRMEALKCVAYATTESNFRIIRH